MLLTPVFWSIPVNTCLCDEHSQDVSLCKMRTSGLVMEVAYIGTPLAAKAQVDNSSRFENSLFLYNSIQPRSDHNIPSNITPAKV